MVATGLVLSESLQKLLQLGDNLCVHCLHEGLEALLSQDLLLGLELLVDELLQRHCVHRVLQGQLETEKADSVREDRQTPPTCVVLCSLISPQQQNRCLLKL